MGIRYDSCFWKTLLFIVLLLETLCIEFAPARGSYANVKDDVMTSQDDTNGEHPKLDFSARVSQKFRQF